MAVLAQPPLVEMCPPSVASPQMLLGAVLSLVLSGA